MNGIHVTQKILALGLCAALSACRSEAGAPAIVTQPVSALVDIGSAVTLSVAAQGDAPLHYQWQANGAAIAGATEPTYAVAAAAMTDAAIYTVKVTNDRGRATSDPAALKVRQHLAADTATTYLTTSQLAINSLVASIAAQADVVAAQISGPAMTFALGQDRVLRFLSPAEQFADSRSVIELTSGDGTRLWDVSFAWHSRLGSALNRISEADEAGAVTTDSAALVSSGVDASGVITAGTTALSYQLQNAAALDPAASLISLATSLGSQDVTAMFVIDGATNTIALQPARLSALVAAVRGAGAAALTFSLSTTDYAQTYGFEHVLSYANAQLDVTVVNADGSAATDLAGAQFVASGFNTGLHAIATADAQGHLAFTALRNAATGWDRAPATRRRCSRSSGSLAAIAAMTC